MSFTARVPLTSGGAPALFLTGSRLGVDRGGCTDGCRPGGGWYWVFCSQKPPVAWRGICFHSTRPLLAYGAHREAATAPAIAKPERSMESSYYSALEFSRPANARRHGLERTGINMICINMILSGKRPVSGAVMKALGLRKLYAPE